MVHPEPLPGAITSRGHLDRGVMSALKVYLVTKEAKVNKDVTDWTVTVVSRVRLDTSS